MRQTVFDSVAVIANEMLCFLFSVINKWLITEKVVLCCMVLDSQLLYCLYFFMRQNESIYNSGDFLKGKGSLQALYSFKHGRNIFLLMSVYSIYWFMEWDFPLCKTLAWFLFRNFLQSIHSCKYHKILTWNLLFKLYILLLGVLISRHLFPLKFTGFSFSHFETKNVSVDFNLKACYQSTPKTDGSPSDRKVSNSCLFSVIFSAVS